MLAKLYALVGEACCEDNPDALTAHELLLPGHLLMRFMHEKLEDCQLAFRDLARRDAEKNPASVNLQVFHRSAQSAKVHQRDDPELHLCWRSGEDQGPDSLQMCCCKRVNTLAMAGDHHVQGNKGMGYCLHGAGVAASTCFPCVLAEWLLFSPTGRVLPEEGGGEDARCGTQDGVHAEHGKPSEPVRAGPEPGHGFHGGR